MDLIDRLREYASTRKGKLAELITEAADALERQPCDDAVSRAAAIAAVSNWLYDRDDGRSVDQLLSTLPSVQPETHDKRTETHACDCISRAEAIDAINHICPVDTEYDCTLLDRVDVRCVLSDLSAVQPGIIRCKDCKHRDPEDKKCECGHDILWQLPRDDNWFCADAERRTDE